MKIEKRCYTPNFNAKFIQSDDLKKIADYVLKNTNQVLFMSITELADACQAAEATVFRFCRSLGAKGYQEFKMKLSICLAVEETEQHEEEGEEQPESLSLQGEMNRILESHMGALRETHSLLEQNNVEKILEMMEKAKHIYFFGIGDSLLTAMEARNKFLRIMNKVSCVDDPHMQAMTASMATSDDLYFTNLLAACCYNSEYSEITHAKFRKCVSYAATRLNIDIQKEGFISNTKRLFGKAGIVHFDYSTSKCQAIPPSFMRVPFSVHQTTGSQLLMLGGCYTRSFIADLTDFCNDHNVSIFSINGKRHSDEEKLLPPIILVGHNFSPSEFSNEYNQQCDILDDNDFALSLLNMVPTYNEICSQFHFEHNDSHEFLPRLEPSSEPLLPRIRSMRSTSTQRVRYIEKANNVFAEIKNGMTAWASVYCHHEMSRPMVIMQRDYSVYLPTTLLLPNYIERALYLMNLGLPETRKVFVCGDSGDTYYSLLNQYKLHNENRCNVLAKKLTGSENYATNNLARKGVQTKHKMEFYISALNGGKYREMYMILRDNNCTNILAVAHRHRVYLNCQGTFFRVDAKNVNEVMTFLIQDRWVFGNERKSIGYSKGGGLSFESVFRLTDETLKLPNLTNFNNEPIQIL